MGFTLTGEIPDYALKPHGGLTGTLIFWKRIGATSVRDNPRSTNKQERSPRP
jgi:hypothetical protein